MVAAGRKLWVNETFDGRVNEVFGVLQTRECSLQSIEFVCEVKYPKHLVNSTIKSFKSLVVVICVSRAFCSTGQEKRETARSLEKISICLNRGRKESVGNDDVSIVRTRKYEMVRMT